MNKKDQEEKERNEKMKDGGVKKRQIHMAKNYELAGSTIMLRIVLKKLKAFVMEEIPCNYSKPPK